MEDTNTNMLSTGSEDSTNNKPTLLGKRHKPEREKPEKQEKPETSAPKSEISSPKSESSPPKSEISAPKPQNPKISPKELNLTELYKKREIIDSHIPKFLALEDKLLRRIESRNKDPRTVERNRILHYIKEIKENVNKMKKYIENAYERENKYLNNEISMLQIYIKELRRKCIKFGVALREKDYDKLQELGRGLENIGDEYSRYIQNIYNTLSMEEKFSNLQGNIRHQMLTSLHRSYQVLNSIYTYKYATYSNSYIQIYDKESTYQNSLNPISNTKICVFIGNMYLASLQQNNILKIYNLESLTPSTILNIGSEGRMVTALCSTYPNACVAYGTAEGGIGLANIREGELGVYITVYPHHQIATLEYIHHTHSILSHHAGGGNITLHHATTLVYTSTLFPNQLPIISFCVRNNGNDTPGRIIVLCGGQICSLAPWVYLLDIYTLDIIRKVQLPLDILKSPINSKCFELINDHKIIAYNNEKSWIITKDQKEWVPLHGISGVADIRVVSNKRIIVITNMKDGIVRLCNHKLLSKRVISMHQDRVIGIITA